MSRSSIRPSMYAMVMVMSMSLGAVTVLAWTASPPLVLSLSSQKRTVGNRSNSNSNRNNKIRNPFALNYQANSVGHEELPVDNSMPPDDNSAQGGGPTTLEIIKRRYIVDESVDPAKTEKSEVFKAQRRDETTGKAIGDNVVIKVSLNHPGMKREAEAYHALQSKLFVEKYEAHQPTHDRDVSAIVMESGEEDLTKYINNKGRRLSLKDVRSKAMRMVEVLLLMHAKNIVWCDMKTCNFVVMKDGEVKGIDLESATFVGTPNYMHTASCAPPEYAVEHLEGRNMYMETTFDIWSLGMALYHLAVGEHYFAPRCSLTDENQLFTYLKNAQSGLDFGKLSATYLDPRLRKLIVSCLQINPADRPNILEIREHPYFSEELSIDVNHHVESEETSLEALRRKYIVDESVDPAKTEKSEVFSAQRRDEVTGQPFGDHFHIKVSPNHDGMKREAEAYRALASYLFVVKYESYPPTNEADVSAIVMESGEEDLTKYINNSNKRLTPEDVRKKATRMVDVLILMHAKNIVWCDMKTCNFVVMKNGEIKGIDLESATWVGTPNYMHTASCAPPEYAVEHLQQRNMYMQTSFDVWSLGMALYHLAVGEHYFAPRCSLTDENQLFEYLRDSKGLDFGKLYATYLDPRLRKLIVSCLQINPADRPNILEIREHPYFSEELSIDVNHHVESEETSLEALRRKYIVDESVDPAKTEKSEVFSAQRRDEVTGEAVGDHFMIKVSPNHDGMKREAEAYRALASYLFVVKYESYPPTSAEGDVSAIVMEAGLTDLTKYINNMGKPLTPEDVHVKANRMVDVLMLMHEKNIVWCDMKTCNFVVMKNGEIKGIDLESATWAGTPNYMHTAACAPPEYAVEHLQKRNMHMQTSFDIWSLGMALYHLAVGEHYFAPYCSLTDENQLFTLLKDAKQLDFTKLHATNHCVGLKEVIIACLEVDPNLRPSIEQIKAHPFFAGYEIEM